jgi:hypothetical protein
VPSRRPSTSSLSCASHGDLRSRSGSRPSRRHPRRRTPPAGRRDSHPAASSGRDRPRHACMGKAGDVTADRRVQVSRRIHISFAAHARGTRARSDRALLGQSCAGGRCGRANLWCSGDGGDADDGDSGQTRGRRTPGRERGARRNDDQGSHGPSGRARSAAGIDARSTVRSPGDHRGARAPSDSRSPRISGRCGRCSCPWAAAA